MMENPTKMDENWGYPYFRKPPYGGVHQFGGTPVVIHFTRFTRRMFPSKQSSYASDQGVPPFFGHLHGTLSGWWLGHPCEKYESQLG